MNNTPIVLTYQNFNECLDCIKQCDNHNELPIIQVNLTRPKLTFRLAMILILILGEIAVVISSIIKGRLNIELFAFFGVWFLFAGLFLTQEIKQHQIKSFWDNTEDIFYCQLGRVELLYLQLKMRKIAVFLGKSRR